jgi:ribosome-binding ATPase YchF (GTP1/OBG family)
MQKGFIKAEVVAYSALEEHRTVERAREHGLLRIEGREYVIRDGDVVRFRFN